MEEKGKHVQIETPVSHRNTEFPRPFSSLNVRKMKLVRRDSQPYKEHLKTH